MSKEIDVENEIREIIQNDVIGYSSEFQLLKSKDITDIIICRNNNIPKLFFIEIKHYSVKNNRIGFGSKGKVCFQPEILLTNPKYFNDNLRWIFKKQDYPNNYYILDNNKCKYYIVGNEISIDKQNNFSERIFDEINLLSRSELIDYLRKWINT